MSELIKDKVEQIKSCIHCGVCLSSCPTYLVSGNEGNSPRGRLYLIRDLVLEDKDLDKQAIEYLDNCLYCRACESACPSGVEYASILDYARDERKQSKYNEGFFAFLRRLAFKFLLNKRSLLNCLRLLYRPIDSIYKLFPSLIKLNSLQPRLSSYQSIKVGNVYISENELKTPSTESNVYISGTESEFKSFSIDSPEFQSLNKDCIVSLALGCVMDTIYNKVHWDSIKVLNAHGYHVYIPKSNCCGALAQHSGEQQIAKKQLSETVDIISQHNFPLVMNSAGCSAFLKGHSDLKIMDIAEALLIAPKANLFGQITFPDKIKTSLGINQQSNQAKINVTYHPACHLNHAQGIKTEYINLLKQIPNLNIVPLQEADVCCGSAGFYNLIKSQMAHSIGQRKARFIKETGVNIVLTANPGCMSQIQAELGAEYSVMHPISLLAETLN